MADLIGAIRFGIAEGVSMKMRVDGAGAAQRASRWVLWLFAWCAALVAWACPAAAQCEGAWSRTPHPMPGVTDTVNNLVALPNGDLVATGYFTAAGNVVANYIARWDGTSWSAMGDGMNNYYVYSLAVLPNGDLVAGGDFTTAGGVAANRIARWNGSSWSPLGSGLNDAPTSLTVLPNGDLVAGGYFTTAGGVAANHIARWNGSSWSAMGSVGSAATRVHILAVLPNGDPVAGWYIETPGATSTAIARWDGNAWTVLGGALVGGANILAVLPSGDMVAAGTDYPAGVRTNFVVRWDGHSWSPLESGTDDWVTALGVLPNGDLVAGGIFAAAGGVGAYNVARWNGTSWSILGSGMNHAVWGLVVLPNGDLVAGGDFTTAGGVAANRIARWNGASWLPLGTGSGISGPISSVAVLPDGDLVAGGSFTYAGGGAAPVNYIARWNGTSWSGLGSGMDYACCDYGSVNALAALPNGDLVAAGQFTIAGGVEANYIARWDGSSWSPLGSGISATCCDPWPIVYALAVLPNGDLVAGGEFTIAGGVEANYIARWDGSSWSPLGSGTYGAVEALAVLPNGDLVAGGYFSSAGGVEANYIARWDGTSWSPLGTGMDYDVKSLAVMPNGDLVAGGGFGVAGGVWVGGVARWNGTSWSSLGEGVYGRYGWSISALAPLPNGDLVVGGWFEAAGGVQGVLVNDIARWNGTSWSPVGSGISSTAFGLAPSVSVLGVLPNGDLVVGGEFIIAGGVPSAHWAIWMNGHPDVASQPVGASACAGGAAAFSVDATGDSPLAYQWQVQTAPNIWADLATDPTPLPCGGFAYATAPSAATTGIGITPCRGGLTYRVRCTITNACGSTTSNEASLSVNSADFNGDGDVGTDMDIDAFFACLAGNCCATCGRADFNGDGDVGTDADIESFFRVLGGGSC